MRPRRAIAVLVGAVLLLGGCARSVSVDPRAEAVMSAVRSYNDALIRSFNTLDMNELNTTATKRQAEAEYGLMSALGEGRIRLVGTLKVITFGDVTFSGDTSATVTTSETWDYIHQSLDTSETVREEKGVVYHLRYDLVWHEDRWLVDRVTSLDETSIAPANGD